MSLTAMLAEQQRASTPLAAQAGCCGRLGEVGCQARDLGYRKHERTHRRGKSGGFRAELWRGTTGAEARGAAAAGACAARSPITVALVCCSRSWPAAGTIVLTWTVHHSAVQTLRENRTLTVVVDRLDRLRVSCGT